MLRVRTFHIACALLALAGSTAFTQGDTRVTSRRIRVNGVDLAFVEQGKGTPVVFVHGAVSDLRYWEQQRDAFARQFRFVAYSFRYHGATAWPDEGKQYSNETHEADLVALISALKAGPVHLVGISYGGTLATMVAARHSQLVRTLTLAEPGLHSLLVETAEGKSVLEEWNRQVESVAGAIKAGDNVAATRHLAAAVTGGTEDDFDSLPAPFRQMLLDNARTLPLLFASPPPAITCEMLRGIKAPTLVVRGARTPRVFSTITDETVRCIPGSRLVVIPKASHAVSYDNPAEFNREVMAFVRAGSR